MMFSGSMNERVAVPARAFDVEEITPIKDGICTDLAGKVTNLSELTEHGIRPVISP
jgi:hypothetical protein